MPFWVRWTLPRFHCQVMCQSWLLHFADAIVTTWYSLGTGGMSATQSSYVPENMSRKVHSNEGYYHFGDVFHHGVLKIPLFWSIDFEGVQCLSLPAQRQRLAICCWILLIIRTLSLSRDFVEEGITIDGFSIVSSRKALLIASLKPNLIVTFPAWRRPKTSATMSREGPRGGGLIPCARKPTPSI